MTRKINRDANGKFAPSTEATLKALGITPEAIKNSTEGSVEAHKDIQKDMPKELPLYVFRDPQGIPLRLANKFLAVIWFFGFMLFSGIERLAIGVSEWPEISILAISMIYVTLQYLVPFFMWRSKE